MGAEVGDDAEADVHVATNTERLVKEIDELNIDELPFENEFELDDVLNIEQTILPFENEFELEDGPNIEQTSTDAGADEKPQIEDDDNNYGCEVDGYEDDEHEHVDNQHQGQDGEEISLLYPLDVVEEELVEMDESDVNKVANIDAAEALMRFYNEVGHLTNLLAFSAFSVLITTPHLEAGSVTHQLADTSSFSTKSPEIPIPDSNIFDTVSQTPTTHKIEDLVIKALSMITYIGILPEYHNISQKSLPRTIDTAQRTIKKQKNASIEPKTVKGKKWRGRVLARKEKRKQKKKQKERKLRIEATAIEESQQQLENCCDIFASTNRNKIQVAGDVEKENEMGSFSKKDIVEKSTYPLCTNNYDYLDFILQSDAKEDPSENLSSNQNETASLSSNKDDEEKTDEIETIEKLSFPQGQDANNYDYLGCILNSDAKEDPSDDLSLISSEDDGDLQRNENEFAQLVITPGSADVQWEEGLILPQEEETEGKSSASISSTHSRSGIPYDILSIEESLEQSFADAMREITEDAEPEEVDIPHSSEGDCLSFVTAEDTAEQKEFADIIRKITDGVEPTEVDIPQPTEDSISFVTAEDIAEQDETLNNVNTIEQKGESNRSKGIQSSLAIETKQDDENVCIETILDAQHTSSKVEVIVYGHDILSPASKPSFWCSWFEAFSWNLLQFSLPNASHEKKGSGPSDSSLCLTETSTNSSSNSSSWLSFGPGTRKNKNQPWYIMPDIMPEFDSETSTLDTAFLEGLSSFCTSNTEWNSSDEYTNTGSEEDEGFVLSRLSIVREFNRIRNDDSLCHSDRVMEMIYFSTTPAPPTRTSVNGLVLD